MHRHHLSNLLAEQIEKFINMNKWYIGQEIVAIRNHSGGKFKEGDIFTISGLRSSCCKCKEVLINIGLITSNDMYCGICNSVYETNDGVIWFKETSFAPLDSFVNQEELNEIKQNLNLEPIWKN